MRCTVHDNIDNLSPLQFVVQRHQACDQAPGVCHIGDDARPGTMITNIRMYTIGHIQGGGTTWQILDFSLGGEDKDLLLEDIAFDCFHKFVCTLWQLLLPLSQLLDPGD